MKIIFLFVALALGLTPSPCAVLAERDVWIDVSDSLSEDAMQPAIRQLFQLIRAEPGPARFRFFRFADNAWRAEPFYEFSLPAPAPDPSVCADAPPALVFTIRQRDQRLREHNNKCAATRTIQAEQYRAQVDGLVTAALKVTLDGPAAKAPKARCTAVLDLLERIARRSGPAKVLILSDSVETCRVTQKQVSDPKPDVQTYLLLLPAHADLKHLTPAEAFEKRKNTLRRIAAWVHVLAPFELDQVLGGRETGHQLLSELPRRGGESK